MNNDLAPTYQRLFSPYTVLWYPKSNNYSIVENEFKALLDYYLESNSLKEFANHLGLNNNKEEASIVAKNIETYLYNCNHTENTTEKASIEYKAGHNNISLYYKIKGKIIQINYDTELVKKTIHPALAYLEINPQRQAHINFDIYLDHNQLCLFRDKQLVTSVPKRDYHLLQGKFIMQLLSVIHEKEESDWIATFHGSSITNGKDSILFIGQSGKGKSTLCSLLAANGFELLADDVSPMLSEDGKIYHNPLATSIKEGAFNTLQSLVKRFEKLPITVFNKTKGTLKYVPFPSPEHDSYTCKAIVMVNYEKDSKIKLERISINTVLETLITESWLSPNPEHAKKFLDWLDKTEVYELTYSKTDAVITEISALFEKFKEN